ncbi:MAG TPA: hypothetical protein VF525_00220 [Pyrinomonadaceae bacterium]|jgi:hypothetical protein
MTINFSRRLAIILGILTPLAETLRRWQQLNDLRNWPAWLDDLLLGGFLLYGAWRVGRDAPGGQRFLTAAWGVAFGMAYLSFFGQFEHLHDDPSHLPGLWVAAIKGIGLVLITLALLVSLKRLPAADGAS